MPRVRDKRSLSRSELNRLGRLLDSSNSRTSLAEALDITRPTLNKLLEGFEVDHKIYESVRSHLNIHFGEDSAEPATSFESLFAMVGSHRPWDLSAEEFRENVNVCERLKDHYFIADDLLKLRRSESESLQLAQYYLLVAEYSAISPALSVHRDQALSHGISLVAPISAASSDQVGLEATMLYGRLLQNFEGDCWNPIETPAVSRSIGEKIIHLLGESESKFRSVVNRFGERFRQEAKYAQHIQIVCKARTLAQTNRFEAAVREIQRCEDELGVKSATALGIVAVAASNAGQTKKAIAAAESAHETAKLGGKAGVEMVSVTAAMLYNLAGSAEYASSAINAVQSPGIPEKYSYLCDFRILSQKLQSRRL